MVEAISSCRSSLLPCEFLCEALGPICPRETRRSRHASSGPFSVNQVSHLHVYQWFTFLSVVVNASQDGYISDRTFSLRMWIELSLPRKS